MGSVDETWKSRAASAKGPAPSDETVAPPSSSSGGVLPTGMKDEQRRLAATALHFALAYAVLAPMIELTAPGRGQLSWVRLVGESSAFGFGVAVTFVARTRTDLRYRHIATLGQLLLGLGALGISVVEQWRPVPADVAWPGLPWAGVWLLVFPLMGPSVVGGARAGLAAAALSAPVVAGLAVLAGVRDAPTVLGWIGVIGPTFAAAGLHLLPALALLNLSEDRTGPYRLERLIGRGGMGEVWLATHKLLARPAAVKLIRRQAGSTSVDPTGREVEVRRFRREAAATSRLQSAHTVRLFDFGVALDGRFFYVMEHLDGLDLEQMVRGFGPLPYERAIHLVAQACLSLAEAHRQGLVHRDVKPSNLFVCRAGMEVDVLKVLDFGLVAAERRATLETVSDHTLHTQAHGLVGTPAFMAPEIVAQAPADARSDLYAMGAVLYFLLTGRAVFDAFSVEAMLTAHMREEPAPPGRLIDTGVPAELDELVLACLAKNPGHRPPSMMALRERLLAIEARDPWTEARALEWWERNVPA